MRNAFRRGALPLVILLGCMFCAGPAEAQTFRGTILGTVSDSSSASVPGAKVVIKNTDTGLTREAQTADDGSFTVPELPIGNYSVTVERSGFQTSVTTGVRVDVAAERRVDVTLKAGDVAQRIEVSGETLVQVETTTNALGGGFDSKEVLNLPVNGRDFQKLLFMVPGATGDPSGGMDSPGSFGLVSVNGNRGRSNNYLLDGTDMNDGYRNLPAINQGGVFGTPGTVLPIEAIAEVRVMSNFDAEYGRNSGAVVNIVTKSGTNEFHGSVFNYFRHDKLNARNFFNVDQDATGAPLPKDKFRNNQFGVAAGGPLARDRTFWYFTYEGQRERVGITSLNNVPSLAAFESAVRLLPGGNPAATCATTIFACVTSQPAGAVNPVILSLFNLCNTDGSCSGDRDVWPAANLADPNFNSVASTRAFNNADSFIVKLDHSFTQNHNLSGRYFFGDSQQSFPLGLAGGNNLPNTNTDSPIRAQLISISYVAVVSPRLVNEARFGWNLYQQDFFAQDRAVFGNPATSIGMNNGITDPRDFGLPTIVVDGFSALGSARYSNPRGRDDTNWHLIDNISWKFTRHDVKFGYEFRRTAVDSFYDALFRGRLRFDGSGSLGIGDPLAEFLAGDLSTGFGANLTARGNTDRQARQNSHAFYLQDSWRVGSDFTVNLGLRWDYYGVIREEQGRFSVYDPAAGLVMQPDLYAKDLNNFGPRASIAWDLGGRGSSVIRAGVGVTYDLFAQDFFTGQIPFNCFSCPGVAYNPIGPDPVTFAAFASIAQLAPGAAIFPAVGGDTTDIFTVGSLRTPYIYNFNLNWQQQTPGAGVFQLGYVGSAGHRLFRIRDSNQMSQADITAADNAGGCVLNAGCTTYYPRVFTAPVSPLAPFEPFYLNALETESNSNYHGLQVSWRQRNWRGFSQQVNYTWSHAIDDASDGQDFVPNASQPQDSQNARANRGNSNFDTRHHFTWSFTYDFPKCAGCGERLGAGWQVSWVVSLISGHPFHVNYDFTDDFSGSGNFFDRPDVVGPVVTNNGDPTRFLDLSAFQAPCNFNSTIGTCDGGRHFGSLGRNSIVGPYFRNLDFSIVKDTRITERFRVHLRADFFNLFNHPNFSNPWLPTFFAPADFNGMDATGRSIGFLPITATVDTGLGNPILGGGGPRSVQFAVKLVF